MAFLFEVGAFRSIGQSDYHLHVALRLTEAHLAIKKKSPKIHSMAGQSEQGHEHRCPMRNLDVC